MFDLEKSIADWRKQMLAAGIQAPAPLEELEIHLREEIEQQMKSGLNEQQAFETTVAQIGQPGILKNEFAKVGGAKAGRAKRLVLTLAGIPNEFVNTNMSASFSNLQPRWATYLKTSAYLLPPVVFWILSMTFVFPKFQDVVCRKAGIIFPEAVRTAIALAAFFQNNVLLISISLVITLFLLEWRSRKWPRYRRAVFGTIVFLLNVAVLIWISTMVIFSIVAADKLAGHTD